MTRPLRPLDAMPVSNVHTHTLTVDIQPAMGYLFLPLRLSAQLLATSWQQTELGIQSDLLKLKTWAQEFDLFAQKQAVPVLDA